MATAEQTGIRREAALSRLAATTAAIAQQLGAEFADFPTQNRDAFALQADQIEWAADTLDAIADAITAPAKQPASASTTSAETNATSPDGPKPTKGKDKS